MSNFLVILLVEGPIWNRFLSVSFWAFSVHSWLSSTVCWISYSLLGLRDSVCKWTLFRRYEKIELWPTVCSNQPRTPTRYLWSLVQEASLLSISQTWRKSDHYPSNQPMKPNNNLYNNRTNMARAWLISDSFPHFFPDSNLGPTRDSQCPPLTNDIGGPTSS